ncbi:MAG: 2-C-methyl-D-erythritol 2,4-cyclodiphosphate synthase, partial [Clostridia bacterium]|nr:2-C-methyl-D-erythritol 2,4-cyclodiphosphate synthase [Clostridia bacterium]
IDAILGAIGERDIGTLFPDDDPKYLDIDSSIMLSEVMDICRSKNYKVAQANIVIVLQKPKIGDIIPLMRVKLARLLDIPMSDVTISAKTNEGVGDIGEGKAVSAYATVIVV